MNYIFLGVIIVLFTALYFIFRKQINKKLSFVMKGVSLFLAVCFFIRYFSSSHSIFQDVSALSGSPFSPFVTFMTALMVWLSVASVIILMMLPFFKFDVLKNYAKTFCLVVSILNIGFMSQIIYSFTGTYDLSLGGGFYAIEVGISFVYSLYIFLTNGYFKISKKQGLEMLACLSIVLLFSIPPFLPQTFFGNIGSLASKDFALYHRLYLYLCFIVLFGLYFLLRNRNREYIRMALLYISLVTLVSYCFDYDFHRFIEPTRWPLHLCNTAMFITPICLMFKVEKVFYFTLFINVLGALLAMFMPNYGDTLGALSPTVVRFWTNHIMAFAMPLLIILLGIYQRPKLKHFYYSMVGFLIYYVFVLIVNAWFTNYDASVDFFFINSDFVAEKLGTWAENLRVPWSFNIGSLTFTFYPLYQFLYFLVYTVLGLGVWFVYVWIFQMQDFYNMVRGKNKKIKLDSLALKQKYNQKEVDKCMNEASKDKLVISGVYKQYGNNKRYSAENVSLQVKAGEILGFLGPNGAGKSTIIKCVVGIQPATKGSIEINGYDIQKQPEMAKAQFGFVPDHYALYEKLTGREYINYIADLYNVEKQDRDERLAKLLKSLNMEQAIDNKIATYSHGMKQKIAIMSALVHNPKLWILDEPLTGLDPTSIYEVKECMREHAKAGNIVFFSSHIIDVVEKICDRIVIIKNGKIVKSVTMKKLQKDNINLEEFYLNIINQKDVLPGEVEIPQENAQPPESKFFEEKPKKDGWIKKIIKKIKLKKQQKNQKK